MKDIDDMDFLGYLRMRAWKLKREQYKKLHPPKKKVFIDEIWPQGGT